MTQAPDAVLVSSPLTVLYLVSDANVEKSSNNWVTSSRVL